MLSSSDAPPAAVDCQWNLVQLTHEAITKTLKTHDTFDANAWDDIGYRLANAENNPFYLQQGDDIAPY